MPLKRSKPILVRCKATTSSGERCKARPHKNNLCLFHFDPKKAVELGRKGGRANRHTYEEPVQKVAVPESAADVRKMLAQTMADVRSGKLDPRSRIRNDKSASVYGRIRFTWTKNALPFLVTHGVPSALSCRFADNPSNFRVADHPTTIFLKLLEVLPMLPNQSINRENRFPQFQYLAALEVNRQE